jgi:protoporphyrinogen oxidase
MGKIIIIGAGLTGLSAAYHLEQRGFFDYVIFEKDTSVGGLCRSISQDGFTFDFTGHLLHTSDPYFSTFIEQIVGLEHLNQINRQSFIYSQDIYTKYPYQINLYGLPIDTIIECIEGYVTRKTDSTPTTFYQWVHHHFGSGFAHHFFLPYQEKIFAYDVRKITASWTGRFVPSTSLAQILRGTLQDTLAQSVGYNAQFLYPKQGGMAHLIKQLAARIKNPIATQLSVKKIDITSKTILFDNGHHEQYEQLISTMPLDILLGALHEKSDTTFATARPQLKCNKVLNFNLGIARPDISDKHWIYFPEKKYPFYRIGFPHNFSKLSVPDGHSSLYGEFAHFNKSSAWVNATLHDAIAATKKILRITDQDIVTECIIPINHAYIIYDAWRDKNLPALLKALATHQIYSIGRYGEWKYSSMQEAVLDGKKIAETLTILPASKASHDQVVKTPAQRREKRRETQLS